MSICLLALASVPVADPSAAEPPAPAALSPPAWEQRYGDPTRTHILGPAAADGAGAAWLPVTSYRPDLEAKDARAVVLKIDLTTGRPLREIPVGGVEKRFNSSDTPVRGVAPLDGGDVLVVLATDENRWRVLRLAPEGERRFDKPLFPDPAEGRWSTPLFGVTRLSGTRFVAFGGGMAVCFDDRGEVLWRRSRGDDPGDVDLFFAGSAPSSSGLTLAGMLLRPDVWPVPDREQATTDASVTEIDSAGTFGRRTRFPGGWPDVAVDAAGRPVVVYLRPADRETPAFACAVRGLDAGFGRRWETTVVTSDGPLSVPAVAATSQGTGVAIGTRDGLELSLYNDEGKRTAGRTWEARSAGFRGTSLLAHGDRLIAFTPVAEERSDGVLVERPAGVAFDLAPAGGGAED